MTRVSARFDDHKAASAAIQALIAASFNPEELQLRALVPDGSLPEIPIRTRSHLIPGFFLGGLVGAALGVSIGLVEGGVQPATSYGALVAGIGATGGAAIGIGSWAVVAPRRYVPSDAQGLVVVVSVHEGRADQAAAILAANGGTEATPRLVGGQEGA